jgi:predicted  nucleic acid-binding Zn-ribbon protein
MLTSVAEMDVSLLDDDELDDLIRRASRRRRDLDEEADRWAHTAAELSVELTRLENARQEAKREARRSNTDYVRPDLDERKRELRERLSQATAHVERHRRRRELMNRPNDRQTGETR